MHSHIGCICLTFLHCAFSNVSSNGLNEKMHSHIGYICLIWWHCQLFSSGLSHLNPSNQSHNFQDFAPLPMCVVFCPNGCFKLSQIYHWLLVSNNFNCFPWHTFTFSLLNGTCLGGIKYMWMYISVADVRHDCQKKTTILLRQKTSPEMFTTSSHQENGTIS